MSKSRRSLAFLFLHLLLFAPLLIGSCSRPVDKDGFILINTEEDPAVLPYRFIRTLERPGQLDNPIVLDGDSTPSVYIIHNSTILRPEISAVVFTRDPSRGANILSQANIVTKRIFSHVPYDLDNDLVEELVVTYVSRDSLWLELLEVSGRTILRKCMVAGVDSNRNGRWDGYGNVNSFLDLNGDGIVEIFVTCFTGHDLYPRQLICVDWKNDSVLWRFDVAGNVGTDYPIAVLKDDTGAAEIVFGTCSVCNGAEAQNMDDSHSYVISLDSNGSVRWLRETGGKFTGTAPLTVDYDGDGSPEIISRVAISRDADLAAEGLIVLDRHGVLLDSVSFDCRTSHIALIDLNSDGVTEICLFFHDNTIQTFTQALRLINKYRYNKLVGYVYACRDIIGTGENQLLVGAGGDLWLFTTDFNPLARLAKGGVATLLERGLGVEIIVQREGTTTYYTLQNNPWYRAFWVKYKTHIIVFLCLLLGGLAASTFYQKRTRFHLQEIALQKNELEKTHKELVETQAKLVAAERYRQAKDIAGGFAHEIRNSLFPAKTWLAKLRNIDTDQRSSTDTLKDSSGRIDEAVSRAVAMTDLILEYTKLEANLRSERVDISSVLKDVVRANEIQIADLRVKINIDVTPSTSVWHNAQHLYVVFNNLLLNSLDALTNCGTQRIISIECTQVGDAVDLTFADNGCGIDTENLGKIFDAFFSTKPNTGTGIGLAMVKKMVEMYGGSISVKSTLGKSTTFTLRLKSSDREST